MRYLLLAFLWTSVGFCYAQSDADKIDPKLLGEQESYSAVIVFNKQADLTNIKSIKGKNQKATASYNQLIGKIADSKKSVQLYLSEKKVNYRSFYIVNMISAILDKDQIREIANFPEVKSIIEDARFVMDQPEIDRSNGGERTTEWGLLKIKAPDVWNLGYTGQGVIVGGQDTGYEWDHNALKSKYRGWDGSLEDHDFNWHDAIHSNNGSNPCGFDSPVPCDDHNHGTHTMGTMVGDTANFNIGVAPGAKWIGCRNMDQGDGTLTTYVECFEWFLAPYPVGGTPSQGDPTKSPHVINNSWSCPNSEGCNPTNYAVMELALNNLRSSGVVIVVSNGNSGSGCSTTFSPPAFFENSFSVGATNSADAIAGFSSRGPVLADGSNRMKPDISAPGVSVKSCVRNGLYSSYSGTSMAGPHVAGLVALIISANPNLAGEVDQIEKIVEQTAIPYTSTNNCGNVPGTNIPNNTFGHGRIDALAAVQKAIKEISVPFIKVDQFGYRPNDNKVAIMSDPQTGYNASDSYTPPASMYLKDASTHEILFTAAPTTWNSGATDPLSGDKAWWFDFSTFNTPGTFYISDNAGENSEEFVIDEDVYVDILKTAFKTFYYQRCGHDVSSPYASPAYHDGVCHTQDQTAKFINDPNNASLYKDLSGGWHDAGDYNKYVNFAHDAVLDMLFAYEFNPEAWDDNAGIPESNNGIPDLLDEVIYEMEWLIKMQDTDGGVYALVGVQNYATASPPSSDNAIRYYGPKTTAASYSTASMMAAAAVQIGKINNTVAQNFATMLQTKAIDAYNWAVANPNLIYNNAGIIAAGEQQLDAYGTDMRRLQAAIYLYQLTDDNTYKTYVESNYAVAHMIDWPFVYPFETVLQSSLLHFSVLSGVSAAVSDSIKNIYQNGVENYTDLLPSVINESDAYKAFLLSTNIGWGSNRTRCNLANIFQVYKHHKLNSANDGIIKESMGDFIHFMHGVNANGFAYLSNMEEFGADKSINTIYHAWFDEGSVWDDVRNSLYGPVPGFIPGGPNPGWTLDGCCPSGCGSNNADCVLLSPPDGQPDNKSYYDWNKGWPQNSWSVTENAIYYQSSYLQLLSAMVTSTSSQGLFGQSVDFKTKDVVVGNSVNGLVLKSQNNTWHRLTVADNGKLRCSLISAPSDYSTIAFNSNFYITQKDKSLILKSPNNNYWQLQIGCNGSLNSTLVSTLPNEHSSLQSGDLVVKDYPYSVIIKDENNTCFKITVDDNNKIYSTPVTCLD